MLRSFEFHKSGKFTGWELASFSKRAPCNGDVFSRTRRVRAGVGASMLTGYRVSDSSGQFVECVEFQECLPVEYGLRLFLTWWPTNGTGGPKQSPPPLTAPALWICRCRSFTSPDKKTWRWFKFTETCTFNSNIRYYICVKGFYQYAPAFVSRWTCWSTCSNRLELSERQSEMNEVVQAFSGQTAPFQTCA